MTRGPNAGSRFLLEQPVTSAGRHPGSDVFLDDITVSRRHVEFSLEDGEFRITDVGITDVGWAGQIRQSLRAYLNDAKWAD